MEITSLNQTTSECKKKKFKDFILLTFQHFKFESWTSKAEVKRKLYERKKKKTESLPRPRQESIKFSSGKKEI